MAAATEAQITEMITDIAQRFLRINTLETQNGSVDFHEVAVWELKEALRHAYYTGKNDIDI